MVIVVKAILAVVRDVEIFPTIVVVVADADALAPAGRSQAGLFGDVGERAVVIVVVETVGRTLASGKSFQPRAIYEKNVGPAVVVIIEDGHAAARGLDDVFLGVDTAKDVRRGEACLRCNVGKGGNRRRSGCFRLLCNRIRRRSRPPSASNRAPDEKLR